MVLGPPLLFVYSNTAERDILIIEIVVTSRYWFTLLKKDIRLLILWIIFTKRAYKIFSYWSFELFSRNVHVTHFFTLSLFGFMHRFFISKLIFKNLKLLLSWGTKLIAIRNTIVQWCCLINCSYCKMNIIYSHLIPSILEPHIPHSHFLLVLGHHTLEPRYISLKYIEGIILCYLLFLFPIKLLFFFGNELFRSFRIFNKNASETKGHNFYMYM